MEREVIFKKSFKFTDEDNCVTNIDVKVEKVTNSTKRSFLDLSPIPEYLALSITGENGISSGQIYDQIKPRIGSYQSLFKSFWKRYHLNDMQPGSNRQMNYIESCYEDDWRAMYNTTKEFVRKNNIKLDSLSYFDESDKILELQQKLGSELDSIGIDHNKFFNRICGARSKYWAVEFYFKNQLEYMLNQYNISDFYMKKALMDSRGLLFDTKCNNYKYGSDYLVKEFDFEELKRLINEVIKEENEFKKENRQELIERYNNIDDDEDEEKELPDVNEDTQELLDLVESECNCNKWDAIRVIALLRSENIDLDELWNINICRSVISYGSIEYYVDSYSILRQIAIDYLMDDRDVWVEAVKSNSTNDGLKDWVEDVVDTDGLGATLNHWDGTEDYEYVFDEEVYIIRR